MGVTSEQIYDRYGKPQVRDIIRAVIANYTIEEVASNREVINAQITKALSESVSDAPLGFKYVGLGNVDYPELIVVAKEQAREREVQIQREEAQKAVELVKIQAKLEQEKALAEVRITRANASKAEADIFAEAASDRYLKYRQLEVLQDMAANNNAVFVPYGALDDLGLNNRIYDKN